MKSPEHPGDLLRRCFFIEDIDGQRFIVSRETGQISGVNENASIMINLFLGGVGVDEAAQLIAQATGLSRDKARVQLQEFVGSLRKGCGRSRDADNADSGLFNTHKSTERLCTRYYCLNQRWFSIEFPSHDVMKPIEALFSTIAAPSLPATQPFTRITIKQGPGAFGVFVEDELLDIARDRRGVDGLLRGILIREAYPDAKQLILLHSSCTNFSGRAVIFAGASGSGKSLLSLAMAQRGHGYFGDDTIGVDLGRGVALSFPTNISIKEAGWRMVREIFPDLKQARVFGSGEKTMKLMAPPDASLSGAKEAQVTALVFIKYRKNAKPSLEPIELTEVLELLDESGAVFHPADIAQSPRWLLVWLKSTPCFRMSYPDAESVEEMLRNRALIQAPEFET